MQSQGMARLSLRHGSFTKVSAHRRRPSAQATNPTSVQFPESCPTSIIPKEQQIKKKHVQLKALVLSVTILRPSVEMKQLSVSATPVIILGACYLA
jgi:hypothetical protein